MPVFIENISFSFAIICYMLAIFKYNFLNIIPIALQNVVDHISDSYIVINEEYDIIDYNKTFMDTFSKTLKIKRKDNFLEILTSSHITGVDVEDFQNAITESSQTKKSVTFEKQIISGDFNRHFAVEITPILSQKNLIGTIILLKDITEYKKALELVNETQKQLAERDRLATLGEIAGGVAHDINSPLSAIQSSLYLINKLSQKCISKTESEQIRQMLEEIEEHAGDSNNACDKIVKIVNSIRNHTRNLSGENIQDFYAGDVAEDLNTLLNHQMKQYDCELVVKQEDRTLIKGDPGKLGQVMTNLIVNAAQAYNGKPGVVVVTVGKKGKSVIVSVEDNAGGIPEVFQEGIFNKILTTKGAQGTGLGLYISNSIITGHFGGKIGFQSEQGKGTTFTITIPIKETEK